MRHALLLLTLLLAACGNTATSLPYTHDVSALPLGAPTIGTITVTDARTEKDPTYLGAIRGGYGNPLKTLVAARPISEEVQAAFRSALAGRHMLGAGPETLRVKILKLSVNQYLRRDASAAFDVELRGAGDRLLYADSVDVNKVNGSILTFDAGIFASTDDLRAVLVQAMNEAIDQALDKPGFVDATKGTSPSP